MIAHHTVIKGLGRLTVHTMAILYVCVLQTVGNVIPEQVLMTT